MKSAEDAMQILRYFDLTRSLRATAQLCGCSPHTVARYVARRDEGALGSPVGPAGRPSSIDPFRPKIEEWVDHSKGRIRADVCCRKLRALGYDGSSRTVRRAVARAKGTFRREGRRIYRPWITEPGQWAQWDWADAGEIVAGGHVYLFCAWLAWSRLRVIIPVRNRKLETLICCLDSAMRLFGGVPSYWLTDNERTVSSDRIAGISVRHPMLAALGAHYGATIATCEPADPESKGGSEATVKIAKADLVPTDHNLLPEYSSFPELEQACQDFMQRVNGRPHSVTGKAPRRLLDSEVKHLQPLPKRPFTAAFGVTRRVSSTSLVAYGGAWYSVPHTLAGEIVWVRTQGAELVLTAESGGGLAEVARHDLTTPGQRVVDAKHYPKAPPGPLGRRPRPRTERERQFLEIGANAERYLIAAAASGASRLRVQLEEAVILGRLYGCERVNAALGIAVSYRRFSQGDTESILRSGGDPDQLLRASDDSFLQQGTTAWKVFGRWVEEEL